MSDKTMAVVAPMPITHTHGSTAASPFNRFSIHTGSPSLTRRSSDLSMTRTGAHNSLPMPLTLEGLAEELRLLSTSPTAGGFSYLSGELYNANQTDKLRGFRKSRSFPNIRHNDAAKSCAQSRPPLRKAKSVRFADSQGLPLVEAVHQLTTLDSSYTANKIVPYDESGDIFGQVMMATAPACKPVNNSGRPSSDTKSDSPSSSSSKLSNGSLSNNQAPASKIGSGSPRLRRQNSPNHSVHKHSFTFKQPSLEPNFFDRVQEDKVVLESIREEPRSLHGIVRVSNLSYDKEITVRWTHDNWRTSHDTCTVFCSNDGATDRFTFELPINGDNVSFAIRYRTLGNEYWDNNRGNNYTILSTRV